FIWGNCSTKRYANKNPEIQTLSWQFESPDWKKHLLILIPRVLYQVVGQVRRAVYRILRNRENAFLRIGIVLFRPCAFIFSKTNHIGTTNVFPVQFEPSFAV